MHCSSQTQQHVFHAGWVEVNFSRALSGINPLRCVAIERYGDINPGGGGGGISHRQKEGELLG